MNSYHVVFLLFLPAFFACNEVSEDAQASLFSSFTASQQPLEKAGSGASNIVFQSADGGHTWQDVSAGLPADLSTENFFVCNSELYLRAKNGMYHSNAFSKTPVWAPAPSLDKYSTAVTTGRAGILAFNNGGNFFQKLHGTDIWLPVFTNFSDHSVRTVFEAADGSILIGCDSGIFKSKDQGKTWNHVHENGWVIQIVESEGVLICTNVQGILRSTDGGEHWEVVLSEGGVGIDVEVIKGGFAAITYNTESETRRLRTSSDGGKTWYAIDAGLPPSSLISGIKQVGETFYCGHPEGIYRSADKGKTWELLLPSIGKKVFNLSVLGNVIYAVPMNGGC
jgi:photosystem II stability/assembly factor-like uncharacterized protein